MLECRYRSNSGGCLKSLDTASSRWRPFKWDIRFVVLKLKDAFFPPLGILAEHAQISMALSSSATEKNFQTVEDMFTNCDVMSTTQAESYCNLKLQSLALGKRMNLRKIRLIDWFTSKRTLSDLDIRFYLFIGAIKIMKFSPISVDNLSVRCISCLPTYYLSGQWTCQLCCCLCRVRKFLYFIKNILICVLKMNECLTGLERHEADKLMTKFLFLGELYF